MQINCHTHLEFTAFEELRPATPIAFAEWLRGLVALRPLRPDGPRERLRAGIEAGIAQLLAAGTTHIGDISQSFESVQPLLQSGLAGVVYLEVIGIVPERAYQRWDVVVRELDCWRQHEGQMRVGLTLHAPYSVPPDLLERGARLCQQHDIPLCIHAAESQAEIQALGEGRGPLVDLLAPTEGAVIPVPGKSPIAYLDELGVLAAQPLLIHVVQVNDDDIARIARSGAAVGHCPRSNTLLSCGRMPLEKLLAAGVPVSLGTDSLASSPSLDVREEAEAAVALHAGLVPPETVRQLLVSNPFAPLSVSG